MLFTHFWRLKLENKKMHTKETVLVQKYNYLQTNSFEQVFNCFWRSVLAILHPLWGHWFLSLFRRPENMPVRKQFNIYELKMANSALTPTPPEPARIHGNNVNCISSLKKVHKIVFNLFKTQLISWNANHQNNICFIKIQTTHKSIFMNIFG